jgi:hypothetical protein
MVAAILFCVSLVTLCQFGLYYWRATIADISMRQVSDRVRIAAGIPSLSVKSQDFRAILSVLELAPTLKGETGRYRTVRAYYMVVEKMGRLIPAVRAWAEAEMDMCSRYMAVLVDQHLDRNMDCAVKLRSI